MNILVINISLRPESLVKLFPIGLGYITTALKNAGFDFDLLDIDANRYEDYDVEKLVKKRKYDAILMGCIVTGYSIIKKLAKLIRDSHPHAKIISGNSVATSIPDTLLTKTDVDIAVMSEGDITIVDLLQTLLKGDPLHEVQGICFLQNGKLLRTKPRPLIADISALPFVDYSIFDIETYIRASKYNAGDPLPMNRDEVRALPVNTARGCVSNCSFCYHVFKHKRYRYRRPESVVAEIKQAVEKYSINYIWLWDELSFFSKKQTMQFAEKMLEARLNCYWTGNCRADLFDDEKDIEIMGLMKKSGCIYMTYSLESADNNILLAMNKKLVVEQFSKQTSLFHKAGIPVGTSIVLGYPQETPETIKKTFDCCLTNKIYPSAGYLLPQPGSEMYEYARKSGLITDEEEYLLLMGDRQDLRLNMTGMSDEEFESHVINGLKRCNEAMGIGLKNDNLVKTTHYRSAKNSRS